MANFPMGASLKHMKFYALVGHGGTSLKSQHSGELEAEVLEVQGYLQLYSKFEASLTLSQKEKRKGNPRTHSLMGLGNLPVFN